MLADLDRRYTGDDYSVNNNADVVTICSFVKVMLSGRIGTATTAFIKDRLSERRVESR
jgi:hypothetical protein